MSRKGKIALFAVNIALSAAIALLTVFFMGSWGTLVNVVFYCIAGAGLIASLVTYFLDKTALLKSAFILVVLAVIFLVAFIAVGELGGFNKCETDGEKIEALAGMIKNTGGWGILIFFLLQILQIVILPIPAAVCYIPGALIWGELTTTLVASAGVLAGSVINYFIGKIWGKKAVVWIAGKETTEKYSAYFGKRGKGIFVIMQILPFFPDDILCMVAGLTSMNFPFFIGTMIIVRPLIIAAYCYLGSGTVIPFDQPWGIGVWVAIFVVCIALAVLSFKYQEAFEKWLVKVFSRKKIKENDTACEDNGEKRDISSPAENENYNTGVNENEDTPPDKE